MYYIVPESLKMDGGTAEVDGEFELTFDRPGGCPVKKADKALVKGRFTNNGGLIRFEGRARIPYTDICCRCLKEIEREADIPLELSFVRNGTRDVDEETYVYEGSKLNIAEALEEAFILEIPYRDYCDGEDCRTQDKIGG